MSAEVDERLRVAPNGVSHIHKQRRTEWLVSVKSEKKGVFTKFRQ